MSLGYSVNRDFNTCGVNLSRRITGCVSSTGMTYKFRTSSPIIVSGAIGVLGRGGMGLNTRPNCPSLVNFNEHGVGMDPTSTGTCMVCRVNTLSTFTGTGNLGVRRMGPRNTLCGATNGSCTLSGTVYRKVCRISPDLVLLKLSNDRVLGTTTSANLGYTGRIFTSETCRRSNSLITEAGPNTIVASRSRTVGHIVKVMGRNGMATVANGRVPVRTGSVYIRKSKTGTLRFMEGVETTLAVRGVVVTPLYRVMWEEFRVYSRERFAPE